MKKMIEDPRMDASTPGNPPIPFDGKRMIFGGFEWLVEVRGCAAALRRTRAGGVSASLRASPISDEADPCGRVGGTEIRATILGVGSTG
jgi:hypothetical protein